MKPLKELIKYHDYTPIREAYNKVRLAGGQPTRMVCHTMHKEAALDAIRALHLPLEVDHREDCPEDTLYITGEGGDPEE